MANKNRGEHDLTVDDVTYALVLTLEDLATLENVLDIGGDELFQKLRTNTVRINHVNSIVLRGLMRGRPRLTKKEADELLPHIPFTDRKEAASLLVAGALNYLNEQQDEQPEEETADVEEKGQTKRAGPLSSAPDGSTGQN